MTLNVFWLIVWSKGNVVTLMFGKTIPLTNAEMPSPWGLALNTHTHTQRPALRPAQAQTGMMVTPYACVHACCRAVHTLPTLWIETKCMKGKRMFIVPARVFFFHVYPANSRIIYLYISFGFIFSNVFIFIKMKTACEYVNMLKNECSVYKHERMFLYQGCF